MKDIILRYFHLLPFPAAMEAEFLSLLAKKDLSPCRFADYDVAAHDDEENLLMFLYFLDELQVRYEEKGIDRTIFLDTAADIVNWTKTYYRLYGKVGLAEVDWLSRHLSFRLFKLGRLQFCMEGGVMEVHIPEGEPLLEEEARKSVERAKLFFARYFPDYAYTRFTCHSWLLDKTLLSFLSPQSNIARFQALFCEEERVESDAALRYIFKWNTKRETLANEEAKSGFAEKIKAYALNGGKLYEVTGEWKA